MGRPKIRTGNCATSGCSKPADALGICKTCYKRVYYALNRLKENEVRKSFQRRNKHKVAKRKREREKEDIFYKIANRLRHRLNSAIKGGGAIDYLGCSIEELKKYLEAQFEPGMTWGNHAKFS